MSFYTLYISLLLFNDGIISDSNTDDNFNVFNIFIKLSYAYAYNFLSFNSVMYGFSSVFSISALLNILL